VQTLRDGGGNVTGFTKLVQDTTDHHVTEEQLHESEERLRLLIESVTDYAIFSIDVDGTILLWNSGAEHIFGYPGADVIGKNFSLIYSAEAVAEGVPAAELAAALRDGHAPDEGWHVRRNGERFFASGQMTRLKPDSEGHARGFVKVAHDITSRNTARELVEWKACHDELTELPNRAFFSDCLRRSIAHAKRHAERLFAVIYIDLDHFKIINDSLGHVTADGLLVTVARLLERSVRPEDVVARLGGDEFAILLPEIEGLDDAIHVAERVHAALMQPIVLEGFEAYTTASMGIALGSCAYDKAEDILRDADTAMYEAKGRGRSRHVLFDSAMHDRAVGTLNLQMDLRRAVARREFSVVYQPIVSLTDEKLVGFEALVRWDHPQRGLLRPADFIDEAENIGLIVQIDHWVLHEACRQIRAWQIAYDRPALSVSVNLSGKHFARDNLLAEVESALQRNGLAAHSLKLEITETVLMENFETTAATIVRLSELGVGLYIDDFGTGYSSLNYLARFPLELLKVDRSFVSQITEDPRTVEIARTIVTLAHNLGLVALAEGIETAQQLANLRALGCEYGQGYWFSPPVSAEAAQGFIGPHPWIAPVSRS
jgi:diguanylate cyclase (GGDEF)-like protein/PAS domain S-box-containing protein